MLDRLIDYVLLAKPDVLVKVAIQDMAICESWHRSWQTNPLRLKQCEDLPDAVERWTQSVYLEPYQTEGRRHQWVLRELIDELQANRISGLTWDQLDFLKTAHRLAGSVRNLNVFERARSLIEPHIRNLDARIATLPVAPGLPAIAARLHVVSSDDITRARPREVKSLAGVVINARGPLLLLEKGHLKILDQVPENCTVVVEDGSVSVDGFIMGRVAASQNCEVRENISGMVIVRQGTVRARGLMVRCFVVSKWGGVYCRQAESPTLVFAGDQIVVDGNATMGVYKAPVISVRDVVNGGEFHATRSISAAQFKSSESRALALVLRPSLNCQDYGEDPGPDGLRLLMKANRMKRQINERAEHIRVAQAEGENAARSAVAYLLGGENANPIIERLQRAHHRITLVNRVIAVYSTLISSAEERLDRFSRTSGTNVVETEDDVAEHSTSINEIHADFKSVEDEGGAERDITDEMLEIAALRERLFAPSADLAKTAAIIEKMRERLRIWQHEQIQLKQLIAKQESGVQVLRDADERVRQLQTASPMVQFLRNLITLLRDRGDPATSPQMMRLQSGFMRVASRTVTSRMERADRERQHMERALASLHDVAERLRNEYQIAFPDDVLAEHAVPQAKGRFQGGVTVYADAYLLNGSGPTRGAIAQLDDSGELPDTYLRVDGAIVKAG